MAQFHSTTKIISRSDAGNAVAAAAYRSGSRMTCERTGQVFNYTRKKEVTYRAILAPSSSPDWVFDLSKLSNCIEASENRARSQLWREVEIALPLTLSHEQHIKLLNDYVQEQFIGRGMVASICLHAKKGNPHAHILLTLRDITPDGFGAKRRDWNDKALVTQWREAWSIHCNRLLPDGEKIDHRSNKDRGIDAPATVHLGRRTSANAQTWDERAAFNAWIQTSVELAKIQAEVKRVQSQIIDLTSTIGQALAERDSQKSRTHMPAPAPTPTATASTAPTATIWTPSNALRIAPTSAVSLLRRAISSASKRPTSSTHPATDLHSAPDSSKETKLC